MVPYQISYTPFFRQQFIVPILSSENHASPGALRWNGFEKLNIECVPLLDDSPTSTNLKTLKD